MYTNASYWLERNGIVHTKFYIGSDHFHASWHQKFDTLIPSVDLTVSLPTT